MMIKPFEELRLFSADPNKVPTTAPEYRMYSAHDYQIANVMVQIAPDVILDMV